MDNVNTVAFTRNENECENNHIGLFLIQYNSELAKVTQKQYYKL